MPMMNRTFDTMFRSLPEPRYMPCADCGASLAREEREAHECERERRIEFQLFERRHELAAFEAQLAAYLDSAQGRFAVWDAERRRPLQES